MNPHKRATEIGLRWLANSSLEEWFPFTAKELTALRAQRDELREALSGLVASEVVSGMSAHIRDHARKNNRPDPFQRARATLNKTKPH